MSTAPKPQMEAQDPVKVDPKHYKVETDNEQVRVLRVNYKAHEKSVMHSHPDNVAVFLNDDTLQVHVPGWQNGRAPFPRRRDASFARRKPSAGESGRSPHRNSTHRTETLIRDTAKRIRRSVVHWGRKYLCVHVRGRR